MRDYPRDRASRQALRQELVEEAIERARHAARLEGISINCAGDIAAHVPADRHRCRNDGSTCLCECHDREPVETTARRSV